VWGALLLALPGSRGGRSGCRLTELFNSTAISSTVPDAIPADAPKVRRKHGWLPLLTILFLISYGLMTMLIVEQGSTIEQQRSLIRELFRDSTELAATKLKIQRDRAQHQVPGKTPANSQNQMVQAPSTQSPSTQVPSSQAPSSRMPLTQNPANQTPSSQAAETKRQSLKPQYRMPSKPAADLTDDRRALITI
jgi:cytoskeletal protein RodZ